MAIRRQNRALFFIVAIIVIVLVIVLRREQKVKQFFDPNSAQQESEMTPEQNSSDLNGVSTANAVGNPATTPTTPVSSDKQKAFVQVFGDMNECLNIKASQFNDREAIEMDVILSHLQTDLGIPRSNSDLWMNWHLRTPEGKEKRIRLEVNNTPDAPPSRELRYFIVDREGLPQQVQLDDNRAFNPTDDVLNQLLKEGEVFYKERSGFYAFSNGERLEYVEKNGELSEIEMVRGENIFKCTDIRARENCRCIK